MSNHRNPRAKVPKPTPPAKRRPHYATHEEQARELLEHICRRDRRVADALVDMLTDATPRVLTAVGLIVDFVARSARAR